MVREGSLLILMFVGQRSRLQLLKIEQKFDTFFVSTQYLKNKKLSTHMPHAERNKSHEQLGFRTFGALLIFIESYVLKGFILIYKLHCRWCIIHICSVQFLTKISRFF